MSPAIETDRYFDAETAIVDADGRVLLVAQERRQGHEWRLPGGGV